MIIPKPHVVGSPRLLRLVVRQPRPFPPRWQIPVKVSP